MAENRAKKSLAQGGQAWVKRYDGYIGSPIAEQLFGVLACLISTGS